MKKLIILFAISLTWMEAQASSFVCAGPELYWSETTVDSPIPNPTPGRISGHITVVYKGEVLFDADRIEGLGQHAPEPYALEPTDIPETVLHSEQTGHSSADVVWQRYRLLHRAQPLAPPVVVVEAELLCEQRTEPPLKIFEQELAE